MDEFKQFKLSKTEWISIEKKLDQKETSIVQFIKQGYNDLSIQHNQHFTLSESIKIENKNPHYYIYIHVLKPLLKKYNLDEPVIKVPKHKLNNADKIRLENIKHLDHTIECIILENYGKWIKKDKVLYFYNMIYLLQKYPSINPYFRDLFKKQKSLFRPEDILKQCSKVIENNAIFDYSPLQLHTHQKDIYSIVQKKERAIIFYTSPTSSGKTLTPIGLCQGFKVIFVCASRHIGVNLAKSAINVGVKTGFAFGCKGIEDIRLHYFSVNRFVHKKPVHADGSKLELLITDIHSYEHAMNYMLSFFDKENIILFWDEPTISMDYDEHPLHDLLSTIWNINQIPRLVLSSATLPDNLQPIVEKFKQKFEGSVYYKIETTDYTTNLVLMDHSNNIIMPHSYFDSIEKVSQFVETKGDHYLKFLSVVECANYILKSSFLGEFNTISMEDVTSYTIKKFYYKVIQKELLHEPCKTAYDNSVLFTTTSACTIQYGPALWLVQDIEHYTDELMRQLNINQNVLENLDAKITFNFHLNQTISQHKKDYQDKIAKDEKNEHKMKNMRFDEDVLALDRLIKQLEQTFKTIQLDPLYIPNTYEHFTRWGNSKPYNTSNVFKGNIEESYANRIMNTTSPFKYKVLLLLGIGVLHKNDVQFNDIMKELADAKQLMLILATSDYIYGTNYQFSHGYLSEDIDNITQEKLIQAIGRVGRKEKNKTFTFRFRDNKYTSLFFEPTFSKEGKKMNELFI